MNRLFLVLSIFLLFGVFMACETPSNSGEQAVEATTASSSTSTALSPAIFAKSSAGLDKYWYQSKGELNVYELEQNRYQGVHPGEALLIFVTEDFLLDKQVKNDRYQSPKSNSTPILKMNGITRFTTGLYDYSIMTSVFTPVKTADHPRTLKVTQSAQDWCGQVYSQINLKEEAYHQQLHSYFESEADQEKIATADFLEEELLIRIRMDYRALPVGDELSVLPSLTFLRLRHQEYKAYSANATLTDYKGDDFTGEGLKAYTLTYPDLQRTLTIVFSTSSPYLIEGWLDNYPSAFDGEKRTTKAVRKNTILDAYWSKNSNTETNQSLRNDLGWK